MTQLIDSRIQKALAETDSYPDQMVSWLTSFVTLTASSVGSITA